MAIPLIAGAAGAVKKFGLLKSLGIASGTTAGVSGFMNRRAERERSARDEMLGGRISELAAGFTPPRIDPSTLPSLAIPDTSAYRTRISDAAEARRSGIGQMRSELEGQFNFDEDPRARAMMEFTQQDIVDRLGAFQQGTRTAFDETGRFIGERRDMIDPSARAADVGDIYGAREAEARAALEGTAAAISGDGGRDIVGVGAADGVGADIADSIAASQSISAEAARAGAQLQQDSLDYLAAASQSASAARQGELINLAAAAQAEAERQFMASEMERVNREQSEFRAADMALREREMGLDAEVLDQLAAADLSDAQARAQAENFWLQQGGLAPALIGQATDEAALAALPQAIERGLLSSAVEGKDAFATEVDRMLADPVMAGVLAREYGIGSRRQAERYWEENYGTPDRGFGQWMRDNSIIMRAVDSARTDQPFFGRPEDFRNQMRG